MNFDQITDRRGTSSTKWDKYGNADVLPMWVADTDFQVPPFILDAIRHRLDHGIIGYTNTPTSLTDAFIGYAERTFSWQIDPDWLLWLPGVVPGLNLAARAAGRHLIIPTPIYYPFLAIAQNCGLSEHLVPMIRDDGWRLDMEALATLPPGGIIMLASPQNPTGRVFTRHELKALAELCSERDHLLCSDDIHCELLLAAGAKHTPIASLNEDIRDRSVSLFAVTKTYNIPGISCAVAVVPDASLRSKMRAERVDLTQGAGPLAFAASEAGFADTSSWRDELRAYLAANAQLVQDCVAQLPGVWMEPVEGTYLAWINVASLGLNNPQAYFEDNGLGLSPGPQFAGDGFVRLNFGCPRATLKNGLDRFSRAVNKAVG